MKIHIYEEPVHVSKVPFITTVPLSTEMVHASVDDRWFLTRFASGRWCANDAESRDYWFLNNSDTREVRRRHPEVFQFFDNYVALLQ